MTTIAMRRAVAVYVALGGLAVTAALVIGLAARASATPGDVHQAWVCAYLQKPGGDELLKTGQNPIEVDWAALSGTQTEPQVGDASSDGNTRSVVVQIGGPDPGIAACPAGTVPTTGDQTTSQAPVTESATQSPTESPTAPRTSATDRATVPVSTSDPAGPAEPTRPLQTTSSVPTRGPQPTTTPSATRGSSPRGHRHDPTPAGGAARTPPRVVGPTSAAAITTTTQTTTGPPTTPATTPTTTAATPVASTPVAAPTTTILGAAKTGGSPPPRTGGLQNVSAASRIPAGGLVVSGLLLAAAGGLAALTLRHTREPAGHRRGSSRRADLLAGQHSRSRRRLDLEIGFRRALGLTALGTVLPGAGLLQSRSRGVRLTMAGLVGLGLATGAYSLLNGGVASAVSDAAGRSALLLAVAIVFVVGAIAWCGSIVLTAVRSRPAELDRTRTRLLAAFTTGMICLVALSSFKVAESAGLANDPATSASTQAPTQLGQDVQAVEGHGR